jgi:hypothetical protein
MAEIISGYDEGGIRDFLYSRPTRLMERYLDEQLNDERVSSRFTDSFLERARDVRRRLEDSRAYRATLATTRRLKNRGRIDKVQQLLDIGGLQHAPRAMQRYLMANRKVRSLWQRRQLEGYRDDYDQDAVNRNAIGDTHDVYRMVRSGVTRKDDDGYRAVTYYLTKEEQAELSSADKLDIEISWAAAEQAIWNMVDDPTSQYNASL